VTGNSTLKHQAAWKHQLACVMGVFASTTFLSHSTFAGMVYALAVFAATALFTYAAFAGAAGSADANVTESPEPTVSEFSDPASSDNWASYQSAISDDRQSTSGASHTTNLISSDSDTAFGISLYDRATGRMKKASASLTGAEENGASLRPAMNGDGGGIIFQPEAATNPVERDINGMTDGFVHDHGAAHTFRASLGIHGTPANGPSLEEPFISDDSRPIGAASRLMPFSSRVMEEREDATGPSSIFLKSLRRPDQGITASSFQLPGMLTFLATTPSNTIRMKRPSPSKTFTPEKYGAVGDGTTDDTQAFKAMHAAIMDAQAAERDLRVRIRFAPDAEYTYTWNRWSWGIRYLTLEGNGASIRNISSGPLHTDMITWWTNSGELQNNTDDSIGYLINTAPAGATSVTLKDATEAANFIQGRWVLVAGYSRQNDSSALNIMYLDYSKVTAIKDGTISLDRPLAHKHGDDWPTRGAVDEIIEARIIPAERDIPWAEHWVIRDLRALPNPHWSEGRVIQIESFDRMEFDNVDFPYWAGGQGRKLIFRNSVITRSEPGNLLTKLQIEDDRLPQEVVFAGAVGAEGPAGIEQSAKDLVARWTLNEAMGTTVADVSGNANTGTVYGATWREDPSGFKLTFDGDDFVAIANSGSLNVPASLTLALWNKSGPQQPWSYALAKPHNGEAGIYWIGTGSNETTLNVGVRHGAKDDDLTLVAYDAPFIFDNRWHHIAMTFDGSHVRLYVDGSELSSRAAKAATLHSNDQGVSLGRYNSELGLYWQGALDDVRIYSRALSTAEVEELANGTGSSLVADPSEVDHAPTPADFRTNEPPVPNLPGPGPDLVAPAGAPAAPGEQYFPIFIGSPAAEAPVIAAWHDTLMSDESFTLAGKYFTTKTGEAEGSDTTVWIGAQTPSGYRVLEADLISIEEKLLVAIVPAELAYDMYLVWVENAHGASLPIAVNRAQARWLGPLGNKAAPGATRRLFGRGLSRDHGTSDAYLYLEADGEWTPLSISEVTPYSVGFLVPSTLAPGMYKIYAHNGHGGQYGWSKALELEVRDPFVRGTFEIGVPSSGIDDTDSIRRAINSVMKQPAGGTVRLGSGTYVISDQVTVGSNVRLIGAGKDNTEIIVKFKSTADNDARAGLVFSGDHVELEGFTIKLAMSAMMPRYGILTTGYPNPCNDCRIADVRWSSEAAAYSHANDQQWSINRTEVTRVESYRELKVYGRDNWIHRTLSYGSPRREGENGAEGAFQIAGEHLVFEHNHVETRHWRPSMEPHEFLARRIMHTGGSVVRSFFAHNTSRNTTGLPWENKGETFLFHHNQGVWHGQAVSHRNRTTTVRTDGLIDGRRFTNIGKTGTTAYSGVVPPFAAGMHAVIAGGTGIGQIRRITSVTNDSITVEEPWRVPPQADSKLVILAAYLENVLYQNNVHAFPDDIAPGYSASVGVSFDGNSFSNVVDGLDSRRAFSALMLFASTLGQSYFNEIRGLKASNTINAGVCIGYYMRNSSDTLDMLGPVMIGNAIRGCEVRIEGPQDSNDPQSIRHLGEPTDLSAKTMYPYSYGNIIEDCVSSGGRRGITSGDRAVTLYRNNNVTVDNTVPQTWSIFSARSVEILDASRGALVGNTYTPAKATDPIYAGAPRAQLGLPVRVVRLFGKKGGSASATVPVWNIGSARGLWDASTKTSWLSLETTNTTLAPEATSGQLAVRARMSGLAVGMHRGSIRLSMGDHVKTISVEVHMRE
jgi:hypothetical protein